MVTRTPTEPPETSTARDEELSRAGESNVAPMRKRAAVNSVTASAELPRLSAASFTIAKLAPQALVTTSRSKRHGHKASSSAGSAMRQASPGCRAGTGDAGIGSVAALTSGSGLPNISGGRRGAGNVTSGTDARGHGAGRDQPTVATAVRMTPAVMAIANTRRICAAALVGVHASARGARVLARSDGRVGCVAAARLDATCTAHAARTTQNLRATSTQTVARIGEVGSAIRSRRPGTRVTERRVSASRSRRLRQG